MQDYAKYCSTHYFWICLDISRKAYVHSPFPRSWVKAHFFRWFRTSMVCQYTCRPCGFTKRFETAHRPWGIIWWLLFFEWFYDHDIWNQTCCSWFWVSALSQVSCGSANLYGLFWLKLSRHMSGIVLESRFLDFLDGSVFHETCNLCFQYTSYPHSNTVPISNYQLGPCQHAIHIGLVPYIIDDFADANNHAQRKRALRQKHMKFGRRIGYQLPNSKRKD